MELYQQISITFFTAQYLHELTLELKYLFQNKMRLIIDFDKLKNDF